MPRVMSDIPVFANRNPQEYFTISVTFSDLIIKFCASNTSLLSICTDEMMYVLVLIRRKKLLTIRDIVENLQILFHFSHNFLGAE